MGERTIANAAVVLIIAAGTLAGAALGLAKYHGLPSSVAVPAFVVGIGTGLVGIAVNKGRGWLP